MINQRLLRAFSTPITLTILLVLLVAGAFWGYKTVTAKVAGPPPAVCVTQPMAEVVPAAVVVNVYNGGNQRGLAGRTAQFMRDGGFRIGEIGNTDSRVSAVIIVGAAVDNPEVLLVASWFNEPEIRADKRPDRSVDILVGDNFKTETHVSAEPLTSIEIPSGEVCLPAPPTPDGDDEPGDGADPAAEPT